MFQVLALPRSRTLWLSMLLDRRPVKCFHEGLSYFQSELPEIPGSVVGSVDTCPLWYEPQTKNPVVVIESSLSLRLLSIMENFDAPFGMSRAYFEIFMGKTLAEFEARLDSVRGDNVLRIGVECMESVPGIQAISNHITPDVDLDIDRIHKYLDTRIKTKNRNIEPHIAAVAARYGVSAEQYVSQVMEDRYAS